MKNSTASLVSEEMKIVHAIDGRIRLRCNSDSARELLPIIARDLRERAGIYKVTSNKTTGSLLVEFDPQNFSQKQLNEFLQLSGVTFSSPIKATNSADSSSSQSRVYEQLLSLVPPLLGLAIVKGIGVTGWKSLLTYLVATGIIREIWEQLIPAASSQLSSASTPTVVEKPELINVKKEAEPSEDTAPKSDRERFKNSNLPDEEDKLTPRQEKESFSTHDEYPSSQEKSLEPKKRSPSKKRVRKTDLASNNPQTEPSSDFNKTTEEATDSVQEITTKNECYWSEFKFSMLSMMLQLMGKLPVQTA